MKTYINDDHFLVEVKLGNNAKNLNKEEPVFWQQLVPYRIWYFNRVRVKIRTPKPRTIGISVIVHI